MPLKGSMATALRAFHLHRRVFVPTAKVVIAKNGWIDPTMLAKEKRLDSLED
jgi:hypothetical protein